MKPITIPQYLQPVVDLHGTPTSIYERRPSLLSSAVIATCFFVGILIFGFMGLVVCVFLHDTFHRLETGQIESARLWWGFALLYTLFGPTLTIIICGALGTILTVWGANRAFFSDAPSAT